MRFILCFDDWKFTIVTLPIDNISNYFRASQLQKLFSISQTLSTFGNTYATFEKCAVLLMT